MIKFRKTVSPSRNIIVLKCFQNTFKCLKSLPESEYLLKKAYYGVEICEVSKKHK